MICDDFTDNIKTNISQILVHSVFNYQNLFFFLENLQKLQFLNFVFVVANKQYKKNLHNI